MQQTVETHADRCSSASRLETVMSPGSIKDKMGNKLTLERFNTHRKKHLNNLDPKSMMHHDGHTAEYSKTYTQKKLQEHTVHSRAD